jgi:hypothetical protein
MGNVENSKVRYDRLARITDHEPTNAAFAALASPDTSKRAQRAAVSQLVADWEWLMIRYDHRDVPADTALILMRGFRHAAVAAARYSHEEGLMTVAWEKMYSHSDPRIYPAATAELKAAVLDPRMKRDSVFAKVVAANVNFHGLVWDPYLWGDSPAQASKAFCAVARKAQAHLPGGGAVVRDLAEQIRKRQAAALRR